MRAPLARRRGRGAGGEGMNHGCQPNEPLQLGIRNQPLVKL